LEREHSWETPGILEGESLQKQWLPWNTMIFLEWKRDFWISQRLLLLSFIEGHSVRLLSFSSSVHPATSQLPPPSSAKLLGPQTP
jgi:hypothetical protein